PVFDIRFKRRVLGADNAASTMTVEDFAVRLHRALLGRELRDSVVETAQTLAPTAHLAMQTVAQPHIDSAISKTINCPVDMSFDDFRDVYTNAYRSGLKGCTTYRPNPITGAVLSTEHEPDDCGDACELGPVAAPL
ncbi:MAG: ribonucleoside-diphosphate reductase, adenosylcobalamin-dependent, partial [Pseudomonadota bacterium]